MKTNVIIPVFNEANAIAEHFRLIHNQFNKDGLEVNYVLVDDGSKDNTWIELEQLCQRYENVSALRLARNFGKEAALMAGIRKEEADRFIIMDSDLQHPPDQVVKMIELMEQKKLDIVNGVKKDRGKESFVYKLFSKGFYHTLDRFTGMDMHKSSDFKIINKVVIEKIKEFKETKLFFRGIVDWVGFKSEIYYFEVQERNIGESKFNLKRMVTLAADAIISYTSKPLYVTMWFSVLFFIMSVILGIQTLYNFFSGKALNGFSTVILLILLTGSVIMFTLGIIGIYIARIYDETKQRPQYIVSNTINNPVNNPVNNSINNPINNEAQQELAQLEVE